MPMLRIKVVFPDMLEPVMMQVPWVRSISFPTADGSFNNGCLISEAANKGRAESVSTGRQWNFRVWQITLRLIKASTFPTALSQAFRLYL